MQVKNFLLSKPPQSTSLIWLMLDSRSFGGIESHVLQLASALNKQGLAVKVVFIADHGEHALKSRLQQAGIPFSCLKHGWYSLFFKMLREKPLLVHTHGYKAGLLGRFSALLSQRPVISSFHAGEKLKGKLAFYHFLDRKSAILSQSVIAVSEAIKKTLPAKARVLDNFVTVGGQRKNSGKQLAFVGRLSHEKGPDSFIRLARFYRDHKFHIYGTGPMENQLKAQATDNVIFHGAKESMSRVWSNISLLIMPSRFEGLPMSALEAMANAIPVLAYRVGSLNKLITNENGYLIPPEDFTALSDALCNHLSCDQTRRQQIGQQARNTVLDKFSDKAVLPQLLEIYHESIQAKSPCKLR